MVAAAYVLTYYQDAEGVEFRDSCTNPSQVRRDFITERKKLRKLARLKPNVSSLLFLDGPGGSGKSRVVKEVIKHAKECTSKLNLTFDTRTIIVSAMSGVAAVLIGGETAHSVAAFNRAIASDDVSWACARLLIINEVSLMNTKDVDKLDENLRTLTRNYSTLFGGLHILFCGDFRQLEPVTGNPLYSHLHADKKWVTSINSHVVLAGLHWFKDDPEWGELLKRIRNDEYTLHGIDAIDKCVIGPERPIPENASCCVYGNTDRTAINAGAFSNALKAHWKASSALPENMLVVKAGNMVRQKKSGKKFPLGEKDKHCLLENCGDQRVKK